MPAYLIAYDVSSETARQDLVREIRSWPWVKLAETAYAVDTPDTPQTVYKQLARFLGRDDVVYVVRLRQPFAGYGPDTVNDWLQQRLR
ncbi:MAG: hypothetical protein BroJett030_25260 [Alphaproteobacteria bacterium]|nr:MAG: hypothetical protein BroJett030_25260 [Alphaproteobacteria bacterium]